MFGWAPLLFLKVTICCIWDRRNTLAPALLKIHAYRQGLLYLLPNLYFLCFSEISSALPVLSSIAWRMLSVVVFCFISVGDGSFQEEGEEGDNVKSKKKAGHQLGVTWRYVTG